MQQAPMNTYQRPMFSQQPIQHLAPQQVQSMQPHLSYIIQGQGQPGNQVCYLEHIKLYIYIKHFFPAKKAKEGSIIPNGIREGAHWKMD